MILLIIHTEQGPVEFDVCCEEHARKIALENCNGAWWECFDMCTWDMLDSADKVIEELEERNCAKRKR